VPIALRCQRRKGL